MGKKAKAKNVGSTSAIVVTSSDHPVPDPVVSPKNESIYVRRSKRLQPVQDLEIEEIYLVDNEKGEYEARSGYDIGGQRLLDNGPSSNKKSLDGKIDDLMKAIQGFKTNGVRANVSCENTSANLIYKSLYLESQKKIAVLTSENLELERNLEIALGKLEVLHYENINKSSYTVPISILEKTIEALVSLMSHAGQSSTPGDDGGMVTNKPTTKKRKNDQTSK